MRIVNLNPDSNIGASAWFAEEAGHGVLLDAGTHPKWEGRSALPKYDVIRDEAVDAIALTHCHHDHVGSLPVAAQMFPQAHVLMSELSYYVVDRVLHNSVNVMIRQRDELGIEGYPLYSHRDVEDLSERFQGFPYNREVEWMSFDKTRRGLKSPTLEFFDAGHAIGSAGVLVKWDDRRLFYTGDVCFRDQTLLRGARFDDVEADVLILETTRGAREVDPEVTRETELRALGKSIQEALERRGCILIPTFALGRTQEILAMLALLMEKEEIPRQPVYIGGLGRVFTEIYDQQAARVNRNHPDLQLREALDLIVMDKKMSERMKLRGGKLFVLTAGMMTPNTTAHDIGMRMIGDENQSIFFVGYADPETPAGRLRAAVDGEEFELSQEAGRVRRNCHLKEFDLTAHANRDELVDLVGRVKPKTVVLAHGDEEARQWMASAIKSSHPALSIMQPGPGESVTV